MSADKVRKAAGQTEPGTRWESLTEPHARLFICHEEIPDKRSRTHRKALRASGRQRPHMDPERRELRTDREGIKLYINTYKYIRLIRSGRPLSMRKDTGETLKEYYRNVSADKAGKAAGRTWIRNAGRQRHERNQGRSENP